jgi:membrane protein YqaA with SNARE-associated domain
MWTAAGFFAASILSALLPWVNAELLMLSAVPLASSHASLMGLVAAVTMGQMTGKSVMYWISRNATGTYARRVRNAVEGLRTRLEGHPRAALGLVLVSALVGVPPFYAVSIAAGASGMRFGRFLAVGGFARFVHFAAVALLPQVVMRGL